MSKNSIIDLASLVRRCQDGDEQAWIKLIDRVHLEVFLICRKMKLSHQEIFEIYGQVSLKLLDNLKNIRSPEKIMSYVASITRNEILSLYRKERLFKRLVNPVAYELYDSRRDQPDEILEAKLDSDALWEAIVTLPDQEFRLIQLLFFDRRKLDYREISRTLGIPKSSIGPMRGRIIARLRGMLKQRGIIDGEGSGDRLSSNTGD
nr:sigma-70 family RNA polymerase sigma factor [candidate division Zixibacteria bacterium]